MKRKKNFIAKLTQGWCTVGRIGKMEKWKVKRQAMMMWIITLGNSTIPAINLMIEKYRNDNTLDKKLKIYINTAKKEAKDTK